MYIGEQLIEPSDARLRLSAQLGCRGIVIDTRPAREVIEPDGSWSPAKVAALRRRIDGFGLRLDGMALDVGAILLDSLRAPERAAATAARLRQHIRAAAEGGVPLLKYTVAMVGITRTGVVEGRGGMQCSTFRAADYRPEADARFSYWGTVLPEDGQGGASPLDAKGAPETCGQVMATEAGAISEADGWRAIEFLVSELLPTAEKAGVKLACHPHDPAYPPGGLNGVHHVLGSLDGLRRFVALAPESPSHGFNFCQGTIAEMSTRPTETVLEAIREFGPQKRIFMVHFRNISGGYLDFREAMPDEGSVDMAACIRAYREVGYDGILCPDHVPLSDLDPGRERFFSFALGYTRGLLQAA
ncbi:mannonate dehydratase [Rhodoplanes roseus]|uniref:mannonate dehydratase n=1 Tax=Rhodoplanes roseus TaxID=29409 RepID=A0A327KLT0_9BRAD|nr:mannonate dehydratase [Rhodoplanes roseus]RAI39457.1 mannonate dehydratase [Rhodoplanes roseus]